jgi:hypothetical protein
MRTSGELSTPNSSGRDNVLAKIGVHRAGAEEAVLLMLTIPSAWR